MVDFGILGELEVLADGRVVRVGGPRTRAVLAMLVLRANQVVRADLLAEELWPGLPSARAAANLQVRLSELRGALRAAGEAGRLVTRPPGYVLRAAPDEVDATRFEELAGQGRAALESGDAPLAAKRLHAALALWRGPALGELADAPFARGEAARLEEARLTALELRIEAELAAGYDGGLVAELEALTAMHPLRERLWAQRMLALYRAGRQAEALRCYQELRRALLGELGIEPGSEVRRLEGRILRQDDGLGLPPPRAAAPAVRKDAGLAPEVPAVRYALSGEIHIAYQVLGDGELDIVFVPGLSSHLDMWWGDPFASRFLRRLASLGRLILFDHRDTGLSDRADSDSPLEVRMDDLRAVMEACRSPRAVLFGYSMGSPMSVLFAATYPDRVAALILGGATARWSMAPDYPCGHPEAAFSMLDQLAQDGWGTGASIEWAAPSLAHSASARQECARWERMSMTPSAVQRMIRLCLSIDVRSVLPAIHVPTLVVQRLDDRVAPPCHGRYLATHLDGARYFEQPGEHVVWLGDTDPLFGEIEALLTGSRSQPRRDRVLCSLVAADLVRPSDRVAGSSDWQAWRPEAFSAAARDTITAHAGRLVRATDAGVLAAFDGPARAIRCAGTLRDRVANAGMEIHIGIHSGEVNLVGDDVSGISVDVATRLAALARPGEVLVSRTVKDLVVGSGICFADRGTRALLGIPEQWSVFAVLDP